MPRGDQGAGIEQQVTARCLHALAGQETLEVQQETRHNIAAKRIANHHFRIDSYRHLAFGLMPWIGFSAAAWATTLSAWVMVWQLWRGSRAMGPEAQFDERFIDRAWRILLAALLMGGVLFGTMTALAPMLATPGLRYLGLALLIAAGIVSYFGIGIVIGAFRLSDFKAGLKRRPKA